jgi:hypothetical protein
MLSGKAVTQACGIPIGAGLFICARLLQVCLVWEEYYPKRIWGYPTIIHVFLTSFDPLHILSLCFLFLRVYTCF